MAAPFPLQVLDEGAVRRWVFRARTALSANRERLNQLNVFPVPDGDTGTNMYLTLHAALESLIGMYLSGGSSRILEGTQAMARSTLLSARGNSGVILSQLVRGLADVVTESAQAGKAAGGDNATSGVDGIDGPMFAEALRAASNRARQGVSNPVEGTILTVATAAADSALAAASRDPVLATVTRAALDGARAALAATPALLPSLAEAGVVDAGGAGYVLILNALHEIVTGRVGESPLDLVISGSPSMTTPLGDDGRTAGDRVGHQLGGPPAVARSPETTPVVQRGPGYEVMFLLDGCTDPDAERLRTELLAIGDSVLVVGSPELRTVHVHTDEAGHAIEAGLARGKVYGIRVSWLHDPTETSAETEPSLLQCPTGPVVAPGAGSGMDVVGPLDRSGHKVPFQSESQSGSQAAMDATDSTESVPVPALQRPSGLAQRTVRPELMGWPRSDAGRPERTFGLSTRAGGPVAAVCDSQLPMVGVVACVPGPGLVAEFERVGARVVSCAPGTRATPQQIYEAVLATGAATVVVLPNDRDALLAADAATELAAEYGVDSRVVRTEWAVQGIAAIAMYQEGDLLDQVVDRMTEAAGQVRPGMVAIASRDAHTEAGNCHKGDVLGFVGRSAVAIGRDIVDVAAQVADRLLDSRAELLTLVAGANGPDLPARVAQVVTRAYPDLEITELDGGQQVYPLLLGAE